MTTASKHGNAGHKWTAERRARFAATLKKHKRSGQGFYSPERLAKLRQTKEQRKAAKLAANGNGAHAGNGVDMDAGTPRAAGDDAGGQHFALDAIPERMPHLVAAAAQRRPRKSADGDGPKFPNNAEGARLAVAMELLRTVNALLKRDDD